jgi:hypothetical protein
MVATISEPPLHPACAKFPPMTEEEFTRLKASIAENGQQVPCVMHKGQLLDGRNRWRACVELGRIPTTREWAGESGSPTAYVVDLNINRRHLSTTQRALLAVELKPVFAAEAKERQRQAGRDHGRGQPSEQLVQKVVQAIPDNTMENKAAEQAARATGANRDYVRIVKKLENEAPDLLREAEAGKMSLSTANRRLGERTGRVKPRVWPRRISDADVTSSGPTVQKKQRLGWRGLAQHCHDFHAVMLHLNGNILVATNDWNLDSRARLLREIRDMITVLPQWEEALSQRDEQSA